MDPKPDAAEDEPIATTPTNTAATANNNDADGLPTYVDRLLLTPYAQRWRDVGMDTYSSEYESGALSTEPNDNWLELQSNATPATAATTANAGEARVLDAAAATFYPSRPRTVTLLLFLVLVLVGIAFQRGDGDLEANVWTGVYVGSFALLTVGVLVFPTGPFVYPHPVVWRLLFGTSVLYLLGLTFVLFQRYEDVRWVILGGGGGGGGGPTNLTYLYNNHSAGGEEAAGGGGGSDECSLGFRNVWTKLDRSALRQIAWWTVKALVVRDSSVLWVLNLLQELTDVYAGALLPGQVGDCWWQSLALDPLVFNALGIQAGMYACKKLEMMELQWEEIISLKSATSRIKRALLRFTPEAWSRIRWLDLGAAQYTRFAGAVALLMGVQLMDLNSVFLQHVFGLPPHHRLVVARIVLLSLIGAPSVQQLYLYVAGRSHGRLGSQCWVYFAIVLSELVVLSKFGKEVMSEDLRRNVAALVWVVVFSSGAAVALLAVYQNKGFVRIPSYRRKKLLRKRRRSYRTHEQ